MSFCRSPARCYGGLFRLRCEVRGLVHGGVAGVAQSASGRTGLGLEGFLQTAGLARRALLSFLWVVGAHHLLLVQAEKRQNGQHDDHEADQINHAVHFGFLRSSSKRKAFWNGSPRSKKSAIALHSPSQMLGHRDLDGKLYLHSAACTRLGC